MFGCRLFKVSSQKVDISCIDAQEAVLYPSSEGIQKSAPEFSPTVRLSFLIDNGRILQGIRNHIIDILNKYHIRFQIIQISIKAPWPPGRNSNFPPSLNGWLFHRAMVSVDGFCSENLSDNQHEDSRKSSTTSLKCFSNKADDRRYRKMYTDHPLFIRA